MSMTHQNKHSSNPPVENLNLPKVKLIKSYKANSHLTVENNEPPQGQAHPQLRIHCRLPPHCGNLNLPKVKLIPSYIANSHFTVENMNLHKVKLILNCQGNFQLRETRSFHAKNLTHSN